jgi:FtsZ-binding cell division protein ZapB
MDVIAVLAGLKGKALDLRDIEILKHAYELQDQNIKQLKENNDALRDASKLAQDRVKSLEQENAELKTQKRLLTDRLHALEEIESHEFAANAANDILAILQSWFGARQPAENSRVIRFADIDRELRLPPGSTKTHIVDVAKRFRYSIEHQGDETILFRKIHDAPTVVNFDRQSRW